MDPLVTCAKTTELEWRTLRFKESCYFYPERDCAGWAPGTVCGRMRQVIPDVVFTHTTDDGREYRSDFLQRKEKKMGEEDFLTKARWIVLEYFNNHSDLDDAAMVFDDTEIISASKRENGDWQVTVTTQVPDDLHYEVIHDEDVEETYIRVYRKIDQARIEARGFTP
jgi:hypothetical protein